MERVKKLRVRTSVTKPHHKTMTRLITISCYGSHLHGDERGSVDSKHNLPGSRVNPPNPIVRRFEQFEMDQPPYLMDRQRQQLALQGIMDACETREWILTAAHIRQNHFHAIVDGFCEAAAIAHALKSHASKHLNRANLRRTSAQALDTSLQRTNVSR